MLSCGETVKVALACEPAEPTANTVCEPAETSTGIVTLTGEIPMNWMGEFATLPESTGPVAASSRRNTIVSPVTKPAIPPMSRWGSVASVVGGRNIRDGAATVTATLLAPSTPSHW